MKKGFKIIILSLVFLMLPLRFYALPSNNRLAGENRYQTAVEISKAGWQQSDYVILAYGGNFPDAIAATPLAKKYNAPILLTEKEKLTDSIKQELLRLKTKNVFLIGGISAISSLVEEQLISININVTRLSGQDRYSTAVKIAEQLGKVEQVIITTGEDFADSLSIAPVAANKKIPILIVPKTYIPESTKEFIRQSILIREAVIIGDTNIINNDIDNCFLKSSRISGSDKYERNINILNKYNSEFNFDNIYLATGNNFADALTGTALAAKKQAPIVLIDNKIVDKTRNYLISKSIGKFNILGGERALPDNLISKYISAPVSSGSPLEDSTNSENSRINTGGFYLECSDGVYISYPKEYTQNSLTKIEENGLLRYFNGTTSIINSQVAAKNLTRIDDWIYFIINSTFEYENNLIYKIKVDGSGLTPISQEKSSQIIAANGWIFYLNEVDYNKIYKISYDGRNSSKTRLTFESAMNLNLVDEWIYYVSNSMINKIKIDGTQNITIFKPANTGSNIRNLVEYNGQLYFSYKENETWSLFRCNLDGSQLIKIIDKYNSDKENFYLYNDYIYFCNNLDIYRTTIDGLQNTQIAKFSSQENSKFYLIDGWLYYSSNKDLPTRIKL